MEKTWLSNIATISPKEEAMIDKAFLEPMSNDAQTPRNASKFL
jgi:hypothetical protein